MGWQSPGSRNDVVKAGRGEDVGVVDAASVHDKRRRSGVLRSGCDGIEIDTRRSETQFRCNAPLFVAAGNKGRRRVHHPARMRR